MARIRKEDHPRILRMIEVEHRKVPDIATEFGCSAANIYALVGKLRRQERAQQSQPEQAPLALDAAATTQEAGVADDASCEITVSEPTARGEVDRPAAAQDGEPVPAVVTHSVTHDPNVVAFERAEPASQAAPVAKVTRIEASPPVSSNLKTGTLSRRGGGAVGARLAKPGFGLMMRTPDGEENLTPFRSLDDLLSAIKPILRATANSSEPVWFSLQPVDLAAIDMDAA